MTASANGYFLHHYEQDLFLGRYKDPGGQDEETWEQVFGRVGGAIGRTEDQRHRFTEMMTTAVAIPSSPQLWNYGSARHTPWQGSSCFTGRLGDSIPDFLRCDTDAHSIYMASGGLGVMADEVRPRGCKIAYSKSRSVGAMGIGGPIHKLEKTTGYITNGGRDRGALMVQLGARHPDFVEFILSKIVSSMGFLDDWPANARNQMGYKLEDDAAMDLLDADGIESIIKEYAATFAFQKEWPSRNDVYIRSRCSEDDIDLMLSVGVLREDDFGRLVPYVFDYYAAKPGETEETASGNWAEANKEWNLPLQNCNISGRIPDALYHAAARGDRWVFSWSSKEAAAEGKQPWLLTDLIGGTLQEYEDGHAVMVDYSNQCISTAVYGTISIAPKYSVAISTWEGLRKNLKPNPKNWKDVDYARFYRKVVLPWLDGYSGEIQAQQVLDLIAKAAHFCADPGMVNEDIYEMFCPVDTDVYGPRFSNPCSEFVCPAGGSCDLISNNLRMCSDSVITATLAASIPAYHTDGVVTLDDWLTLRASPEFEQYLANIRKSASLSFEYIAEAMEKNVAPVDYIHQMSLEVFRTVGVGVMGLAEAMMRFHVPYGSDAGVFFAAATQAEVYLTCWEASFALVKGDPTMWRKPEGWHPERMTKIFNQRLAYSLDYQLSTDHMTRILDLIEAVERGEYASHTTVTSIAPTGSISQIAGWQMTRAVSNGTVYHKAVSSGGEPPFGWRVDRQDNSGEITIMHDLWQDVEHNGKPWMITANELSAAAHVTTQAALCAFTCMSASKTINLPENATVQDIMDAYMLAWKLGIPGTSVYRNNSKPVQVLTAIDCASGECEPNFLKTQEPAAAVAK